MDVERPCPSTTHFEKIGRTRSYPEGPSTCGGCTAKIAARVGAAREKARSGRICHGIDLRENQGTWGLAREDARESAQNCTQGRSRDRRRAEVDGEVPRRYRVHGRDVQKRRQDDCCQGSCAEGPFRFIQLQPRRECRAIDIHEGDKVDEAALKDLIRAAVALNLMVKSKPKPRQAGPLASSQVLPHSPSTSASMPPSWLPKRVRVMRERQQNHRCGTKTRLDLPLCLSADSDAA
jgi:hypothetical protein